MVVRGKITFISIEELVHTRFDRPPDFDIAGAMHWKQFRMRVIYSKSLKDHASPTYAIQLRVQDASDFARRGEQSRGHGFRQSGHIAIMMFLCNYDRHSGRVRID
jgi:hypothetical protein